MTDRTFSDFVREAEEFFAAVDRELGPFGLRPLPRPNYSNPRSVEIALAAGIGALEAFSALKRGVDVDAAVALFDEWTA